MSQPSEVILTAASLSWALSCDPNDGEGARGVGRSGRGSEQGHTSLGTCGLQVVSPWVASKLPPQKVSLREAHTAVRSASSKYSAGTVLLDALGCMSVTMTALHQPPAHMCPGRQCRTWETAGPSPPSVGLTWRGGRGELCGRSRQAGGSCVRAAR